MSFENNEKSEQNPYEGMSRAEIKAAMREAWSVQKERFFAKLADIEIPEDLLAFSQGGDGVDDYVGGVRSKVVSFSSETMTPEYAEANNYFPGSTELFFPLARLPKKLQEIFIDSAGSIEDMDIDTLVETIASQLDQSDGYTDEEGKSMELSSELRTWLKKYLLANGYSDVLTADEKSERMYAIASALKT